MIKPLKTNKKKTPRLEDVLLPNIETEDVEDSIDLKTGQKNVEFSINSDETRKPLTRSATSSAKPN